MDLFTNSHYRTFVAKANEVDDIVADAAQRAQRGEAPLDAWKCVKRVRALRL